MAETKRLDLDRLAVLARIHITRQEQASFKKELHEILEFLDCIDTGLNQVTASGKKIPLVHVPALRPDIVSVEPPDGIVEVFPKKKSRLLEVPKIVFQS